MCGITGIFAFNQIGTFYMINLGKAIDKLSKRGPDGRGSYVEDNLALGHRRLSIIDTSYLGNQPMKDETGRYVMVFNGEIFNFRELKKQLLEKGETFVSESDSEVLLKLYIREKAACLQKLVGFFAFAVYDKEEKSLFIARDRMGIKPLLYYYDEDKFVFASEMKALLAYNIPRELDYASLYQYLQLNYVPGTTSMLKGIKKLAPGSYMKVKGAKVEERVYYTIPYDPGKVTDNLSYDDAKTKLAELLEESVKLRLVSDVPLGAFLSGGIDSSIIVALASRHIPDLNTYSIGFKDEPFFDETEYASLVAKKFGVKHTVFSLTNEDLFEHVFDMLDYIDEPFADSSALAVYILSKRTADHVKVALSGDGADELFGGYNKHQAEYMVRENGLPVQLASLLHPLVNLLPQSRNSYLGNKVRQIKKLGEGASMNTQERYWRWCGFMSENEAGGLLSKQSLDKLSRQEYEQRKKILLSNLTKEGDLNEVLKTDTNMVLVNDMLFKVDSMSMANSLEVRVPFLDHRVVNFAFQLPVSYKVNNKSRKRIVQDAYKDILPPELYNRAKKGFEVPLLKWQRKELKSLINNDLLNEDFIKEQGIFELETIKRLKKQLFSANPGDIHAVMWGLIVFQYWWKKYLNNNI